MLITFEDRPSDSPFVERVWRSQGSFPFLNGTQASHEYVATLGYVTHPLRGRRSTSGPTRRVLRLGFRVRLMVTRATDGG